MYAASHHFIGILPDNYKLTAISIGGSGTMYCKL